ncbi:MAG TPA: CheY-P-specific phosphatase CheC [Firmicutes bacterium]|jgi:chemotaxis protein CheC|nr:CheY-P-specific phosphatase CheC [Bacillota bacterium]
MVNKLTPLQLDAIREVGNIGAAHAATVLSQLLNRKVFMTVPQVNILPLAEACDFVGGPEQPMVGVYLRVFGEAPSKILYLFPEDKALFVAGLLINDSEKCRNILGELEVSALKEIGNILTGAYVYAFSNFTGLNMLSSVPALAFDMVGAILNTILADLGEMGDYAVLIETQLTACDLSIDGHFFLVPDPGSLNTILDALGVKNGCQIRSGSECQK